MVAPALFCLPIFSEALMLVNGRKVDKPTVENLLSTGASIAVQPGGVKEQIVTRHDQEQAIFPANLGFVRMAIKHGLALLPVYIFNENQIYKRVGGYDTQSQWLYKNMGFGLPAFTGKAHMPMSVLMPRAADVHVRWGAPIEVGPAEEEPSEDRVEELFLQYLTGLLLLFDTHKDECLAPDVAANGLKIIRLDGKAIPEPSKSNESKLPLQGPSSSDDADYVIVTNSSL